MTKRDEKKLKEMQKEIEKRQTEVEKNVNDAIIEYIIEQAFGEKSDIQFDIIFPYSGGSCIKFKLISTQKKPFGGISVKENESSLDKDTIKAFIKDFYTNNTEYEVPVTACSYTNAKGEVKETHKPDFNASYDSLRIHVFSKYPFSKIQRVETISAFDFKGNYVSPEALKDATEEKYKIDSMQQEILVYNRIPYSDFECNDLYDAIIDHICEIDTKPTDQNKLMKKSLLQIISMIALEDRARAGARPGIVTYGSAGTGKSLLIRMILSVVGIESSKKVDTNEIKDSKHSDMGKYRFVYMDEITKEGTQATNIFDKLKEIMRQPEAIINPKHKQAYTVPCSVYPMVASNRVPFRIPSENKDDKEPWMWVKELPHDMTIISQDEHIQSIYHKYLKQLGNSSIEDLGSVLQRGAYKWLEKVLLKHYNEVLDDRKAGECSPRFGVKMYFTNEYSKLSLFDTEYKWRHDASSFFEKWYEVVQNGEEALPIDHPNYDKQVRAFRFLEWMWGYRDGNDIDTIRVNGNILIECFETLGIKRSLVQWDTLCRYINEVNTNQETRQTCVHIPRKISGKPKNSVHNGRFLIFLPETKLGIVKRITGVEHIENQDFLGGHNA